MLLWTPPVPISRSFSYPPWVSTADISRPEKYQVVVFWGHPPWLVFAQSHCCHLLHSETTNVSKLSLWWYVDVSKLSLWWCVHVRKLSLWWCWCQKTIPVMVLMSENYPCDDITKLSLWWSVMSENYPCDGVLSENYPCDGMLMSENYPCDGVLMSKNYTCDGVLMSKKLSLWWRVVRKLSLWWCVDVRKTIPVMACCQKTIPGMVCWCQKNYPCDGVNTQYVVCQCQETFAAMVRRGVCVN